MRSKARLTIAVLVVCFTAALALAAPRSLVDELPEYKPESRVSGTIKSVGSDTMNNLLTYWAEGFRGYFKQVQFEVEGKGSSTAPPALTTGSASFGPMSREMKSSEIDAFVKHYGYKPVALRVSIDLLAVYVHKDNPIQGLTLPQLDAIYSKTRILKHGKEIRTWGDLGLEGEWADKPISLYSRNAASGTYGYFKEKALGNGDFKDSVKEQPGSAAVVQGVANDRYGIGYSGIGYRTASVRAVPLALDSQADLIPADADLELLGKYPLVRFLLVYVNYNPSKKLDPLRREFIRYVYSRQGQEEVIKDGYLPVTPAIARKSLESVGINK